MATSADLLMMSAQLNVGIPVSEIVTFSTHANTVIMQTLLQTLIKKPLILTSRSAIINARKRRGSQLPWQHLLDCHAALGLQHADRQLSKMLVCDFILDNHDRHWNNLGVLFDAHTMEAKRVAPIFDTGLSLWSDAFELSVPVDNRYRPPPLVRERACRIRPEDRLALICDFSWLDTGSLGGFSDDVRSVLAAETRLLSERIDATAHGVERNIEYVKRIASHTL